MKGNKNLEGHKQSEETKRKIGESVRRAYSEGRKVPTGACKRKRGN